MKLEARTVRLRLAEPLRTSRSVTADRARRADLDGHLLLAHDPWQGIGGENGTVRSTSRPGPGLCRPTAEDTR
ncbi:hypothetical protein KNE206_73800 [Kitasatospora sp. NE20-6]